MGEIDLRETLDRIPVDDPPYTVPVEAIVTAGRRAERRSRLLATVSAALICGTAMLAVVAFRTGRTDLEPRLPAGSPPSVATRSQAPAASSTPLSSRTGALGTVYYFPVPETGVFGAMLDAVRAVSPAGFSFEAGADTLGGEWRIDGNANDGRGPGRLFISVSRTGHGWMAHPCRDPEFADGVSCVERRLTDGSLLIRRGRSDHHGYQTIRASLIRENGVSVDAETGNYRVPIPPPANVTSGPPASEITRDAPPYNANQLQQLVQALDRSVRACFSRHC
jgi:hypothetical protein